MCRCRAVFVADLSFIATLDLAELKQASADMAWWYGWSQGQIDALNTAEFLDWQEQITRQVKAGYSKM